MKKRIFTRTSKRLEDTLRGFLLTEAIVSLFVLSVGLITVIALISSSLRQSYMSRDTIIAVELAQEGVELVRNVRDNGFINNPSDPFYKFSMQKHCRIDYTVSYNAPLDCTGSLQSPAYYALAYTGGFYKHGAGGRFSRYVYINFVAPAQAWTVRSFVYWGGLFTPPNSGGSPALCTIANKCVFTEISLTNWR